MNVKDTQKVQIEGLGSPLDLQMAMLYICVSLMQSPWL